MQYGGPIFKTHNFDMTFDAQHFEFMAGVARAMNGETLPVGPQAMSMTIRQPLGVVGLITPWNFPLVTAISKITPALMMGNTAIVKPASCAPLTVLKLGELGNRSRFSAGRAEHPVGPRIFCRRSDRQTSLCRQGQLHGRFGNGQANSGSGQRCREAGCVRTGRQECFHRACPMRI